MNEAEVFVLADRALAAVVARIRPDQWDMPMPPSFARRGSDERADVARDHQLPRLRRRLGARHAGRPHHGGGRRHEVRRRPPGRHARSQRFEAIVAAACAAASARDRLRRASAHLSFGDYTVREYFWQINSFRGLRAHDIAKVIGVEPALPPELVQGIWDEVSPHAEEWRTIGVFPAAVPVPEDAPLLDRLLGLTGRDPDGCLSRPPLRSPAAPARRAARA